MDSDAEMAKSASHKEIGHQMLKDWTQNTDVDSERKARSLIVVDSNCSMIRSAQPEELADLELGDVSGRGGMAIGVETPPRLRRSGSCRY
jgi:hypothetical protein